MQKLVEKCPKCGKDLFLWSDGTEFGQRCDNCGYATENDVVMQTAFLEFTDEYKKKYENYSISRCAVCNKEMLKKIELNVCIPDKREREFLYDKFLCANCLLNEIDRLDREGIIKIYDDACRRCTNRGIRICAALTNEEIAEIIKQGPFDCWARMVPLERCE